MVSCCKLSWCQRICSLVQVMIRGNNVPTISSKRITFSVFTRKGRIPKHSFHPLRSWFWLRESRFLLCLHRARSPDHSQQSSLREPVPNLLTLRASQVPQMGVGWEVWSHEDCDPGRLATTIRSQRQGCVGWGGAGEFTAASRPGPSQQAALV